MLLSKLMFRYFFLPLLMVFSFATTVFGAPSKPSQITTSEGAACNGSLTGELALMTSPSFDISPRTNHRPQIKTIYNETYKHLKSITEMKVYLPGFTLLGRILKTEASAHPTKEEALYLTQLTGTTYTTENLLSEDEVVELLTGAHYLLTLKYLYTKLNPRMTLFDESNTQDDVLQSLMLGLRIAIYSYAQRPDLRKKYYFSSIAYRTFWSRIGRGLLRGALGIQDTVVGKIMRKIRRIEKKLFLHGFSDPTRQQILLAYAEEEIRPTTSVDFLGQEVEQLEVEQLEVKKEVQETTTISEEHLEEILSLLSYDQPEANTRTYYQAPSTLDASAEKNTLANQTSPEASPEAFVDTLLFKRSIEEAISAVLNDNHILILRLRFGIGRDVKLTAGYDPLMSQGELARIMNLSESRVQQLEAEALKKLEPLLRGIAPPMQ